MNPLAILGNVLHLLISLYILVVVIAALISWVSPNPRNQLVQFLWRATAPANRLARRYLPVRLGPIDFAPVVVIAALYFIDAAFVNMLIEQGNVVANLILGFTQLGSLTVNFFLILVIIGALLSWISPDPYNPVVRVIYAATEPCLSWFRRRLPLRLGGIDFSPIVVIALLMALLALLGRIARYAVWLKQPGMLPF
ncbi:MAG: YGGT family protein [Deltaproteobacteria bacterium ADurb.Bin510]|nr:MAG: YGGT family protein [Deltaproteobacteria bacterium ADurb.Bin510]